MYVWLVVVNICIGCIHALLKLVTKKNGPMTSSFPGSTIFRLGFITIYIHVELCNIHLACISIVMVKSDPVVISTCAFHNSTLSLCLLLCPLLSLYLSGWTYIW